jgi:hypothetical protein
MARCADFPNKLLQNLPFYILVYAKPGQNLNRTFIESRIGYLGKHHTC